MIRKIKYRVIHLLTAAFILFSCKKEISCEGCNENNKPPIAIAGPDRVITLPTDSISLDGSASNDPDGTISEWLWKKIEGPASFNILVSTKAKTVTKNLVAGTYQFELSVKDDRGLSTKDTMQVTVNSVTPINRPPVADAGADQTITLPTNSINLNGSGSTDPDNNIVSYLWTKIGGPLSFIISNANSVQTQVTGLVEGVYQFELKVTDAGGLFSTASIKILVVAQPVSCNNSNRPMINAQLIPFGTLSKGRAAMAVASAGNKILFAGGNTYDINDFSEYYGTKRVDIYDLVTQTWSIAELNTPRSAIAAVTCGNKIFFAGGDNGDGAFNTLYSTVDIYDAVTNKWTVTSLSQPRSYIAAASVGNKVFFAGGEKDWDYNTSNVVDVYDVSTGGWSVQTLSEPRAYISAVSANNKVYFAGGEREDRWYLNPSTTIDIYDNANNSWSTSILSVLPGGSLSGVTASNKIYWATGCGVEIKDLNTLTSSEANLFIPGGWIVDHGQNAVVKDNRIIFFRHHWSGANDRFDIYDISSNTWSIGVLPINNVRYSSIICVNNIIYIAGGILNGNVVTSSNQVWKLEF